MKRLFVCLFILLCILPTSCNGDKVDLSKIEGAWKSQTKTMRYSESPNGLIIDKDSVALVLTSKIEPKRVFFEKKNGAILVKQGEDLWFILDIIDQNHIKISGTPMGFSGNDDDIYIKSSPEEIEAFVQLEKSKYDEQWGSYENFISNKDKKTKPNSEPITDFVPRYNK